MDVYCAHHVDSVLDPPLPPVLSDRFPFAVSRGHRRLSRQLPIQQFESHAIDTRYSLPRLPFAFHDLLSRYGLLRPFSSLLPGYPLPQRATIYIIRVLLKARAPHASTCDPPVTNPVSRCFASSRRSGRAGFPSDKPTSPLLIVLPLELRRRHDGRSLINQVTLPRFCAPSAPRRIELSFLEVPFTRSFPCPSGFDSRLDFYAYRSLRDSAVQPPGLCSFAASCFRLQQLSRRFIRSERS